MNHLRQLLDAIQQLITLTDTGLILCILGIRTIRLNHAANLVHHAVQATGRNKL